MNKIVGISQNYTIGMVKVSVGMGCAGAIRFASGNRRSMRDASEKNRFLDRSWVSGRGLANLIFKSLI
jgi:hypothetical protein